MRIGWLAVPVLALGLASCGVESGTTKAYGQCHASLVGQGLSQDAARAFCVTSTEGKASVELTGAASYDANGDAVIFRGHVTNPSRDYVVTGFNVRVQHKSEGKENLFRVERAWIEPGASFDFTVAQSGMAYVPPPNRRGNPAPDGTRWNWDVVDVRGILISP